MGGLKAEGKIVLWVRSVLLVLFVLFVFFAAPFASRGGHSAWMKQTRLLTGKNLTGIRIARSGLFHHAEFYSTMLNRWDSMYRRKTSETWRRQWLRDDIRLPPSAIPIRTMRCCSPGYGPSSALQAAATARLQPAVPEQYSTVPIHRSSMNAGNVWPGNTRTCRRDLT